jgi:hypothetical protein
MGEASLVGCLKINEKQKQLGFASKPGKLKKVDSPSLVSPGVNRGNVGSSREPLLKGKAQYSIPSCPKKS